MKPSKALKGDYYTKAFKDYHYTKAFRVNYYYAKALRAIVGVYRCPKLLAGWRRLRRGLGFGGLIACIPDLLGLKGLGFLGLHSPKPLQADRGTLTQHTAWSFSFDTKGAADHTTHWKHNKPFSLHAPKL